MRRMLAMAALLAAAGSLSAQFPDSTVIERIMNHEVRLNLGGTTVRGLVLDTLRDDLFVQVQNDTLMRQVDVPKACVRRLWVRTGTRGRGSSVLRMGAIGLAAGVAVGVAFGVTGRDLSVATAASQIGLGGMVVGGAIGFNKPLDTWRELRTPLPGTPPASEVSACRQYEDL